ncbi:hypothetical protein HDU83_003121 [Entophlyctis luteolus]|nr:hypothetical protein HDU82_004447 [Entophlyctis luteolus]KAJ3346388.1 hypothetical protein HDU83_003121 [Entophlyctis luteolus]
MYTKLVFAGVASSPKRFKAIAFSVIRISLKAFIVFQNMTRGETAENLNEGMTIEELAVTTVYEFRPKESASDAYMDLEPGGHVVVTSGATVKTGSDLELKDFASSMTCSVCLCDYKAGQFLRQLPCFHGFHRECIDGWLVEALVEVEAGRGPTDTTAAPQVVVSH